MRTTLILTLVAGLTVAAGCEKQNSTPTGNQGTSTPGTAAPDNTGVNTRDRDGTTQTPGDQGQNQADVRIVAEIRRAITDDSAMSMNARNCKIVVSGGTVTLRGPVDSQAEKDAVEAKARAVTGVTSVVNELEVKNP
jgi:osmotically-inducible protein OsmY